MIARVATAVLSCFALAALAPAAAEGPRVGGRVTAAGGLGLADVEVTLVRAESPLDAALRAARGEESAPVAATRSDAMVASRSRRPPRASTTFDSPPPGSCRSSGRCGRWSRASSSTTASSDPTEG